VELLGVVFREVRDLPGVTDVISEPAREEPAEEARRHTDATRVRFGIVGAARIAPRAIVRPAADEPEAEVIAVAARDLERAHGSRQGTRFPGRMGRTLNCSLTQASTPSI
jgi:hypothetical protein